MPGFVIVTYNSVESIGACLDACLASRSRDALRSSDDSRSGDVVVVDNASHDGTLAEVRRRAGVRLIANAANRGFAAAANQGFASLKTDAILLLNPDTVVGPGLPELEAALSAPDVAAATGTLIGGDGHQQHGFNVRAFPTPLTMIFELLGLNRLLPWNPVNRRYRVRLPLHPGSTVEVDQPAGAFLMVKRAAWLAIGGFDERFYPLWFEDVDFCKRLRDRGFRILYVPAASARHAGGASIAKLPWVLRQQLWYGSLLTYASKHYSGIGVAAVASAVVVGCIARACGRALTEFSLEPFKACSRVVRLVSLYPRKGERGEHRSARGAV